MKRNSATCNRSEKEETVPVAVRMPKVLREELAELAARESRDLSHQIIYMLRQQIGAPEAENEKPLVDDLLPYTQKTAAEIVKDLSEKSGNEMMRELCSKLQVPMIEYHGRCYALARNLSAICGYSNLTGLCHVYQKHRIRKIRIGEFPKMLRAGIRERFSLSKKDSMAVFVGWDVFVMSGLGGRKPPSEAIKAYTLAKVAGMEETNPGEKP